MKPAHKLPPFDQSLASTLLMAREAIMAPLRPVLRAKNITEPQWRVMRVINDQGRTDATGLAECALLHAPSVTRILKELDDRGLVVREPDPDDKRRVMVSLSPLGRELVKAIARPMGRILGEYSDRFGPERLNGLMDELRALAEAVKGVE